MKQFFLVAISLALLTGCSNSGTKNGASSDTSAPVNSTTPTPTNPGGLQTNGGNGSGGDTGTHSSQDTMH